MTRLSVTDIPYRTDAGLFFEAVRDLPQASWLDSGRPWSRFGRYDIICARPDILLTTRGRVTRVSAVTGEQSHTDNPFDLVERYLAPLRADLPGELPFCGGALGYFSYDLSRAMDTFDGAMKRTTPVAAPETAEPEKDIDLPDMHIGIYSWALVLDHQRRRAWLTCLPHCRPDTRREILGRLASAGGPGRQTDPGAAPESFEVTGLQSNLDPASYRRGLARIDDYIHAGDCYQVNFAQRFSAGFSGCGYAAYRRLRQALPSPFSAFISLDHLARTPAEQCAVLSLSPERFLRLRGREVQTRPIKGTLPRGATPEQDRINARALRTSPKDRAENLMIVDLLRNDLGKSCLPGSVRVPELFALESFPNVHHLVSTVTGTLDGRKSPLNLLKGCFPGGSITGAPKRRAMEIIAELEPHCRSVYCGSIGYLSANGNMDTNIAIRTLVCDRDRIHCWGGGGIVADSRAELEYAESLAKIQVLLDALRAGGNHPQARVNIVS